jgi:hypothetical protein
LQPEEIEIQAIYSDGQPYTRNLNECQTNWDTLKISVGNRKTFRLSYNGVPAEDTYINIKAPTFTPVTSSNSITGDFKAVAFGNNRFVIVGHDSSDSGGVGGYSSNGRRWTAADSFTVPGSTSQTSVSDPINAVAYGVISNDISRFVAGGEGWGGSIGYSPNGRRWTAATSPAYTTSETVNALAYGNRKYIAVGNGGKIAHSVDGASWTIIANTTIFGSDNIISANFVNDKFIISSDSVSAYSSDAERWTEIRSISGIKSVAYGNGKYIAVGESIYSSVNGTSWSSVNNASLENLDDNLNSIVYNDDGLFVAVNDNGTIWYSTDGENWNLFSVSGIDNLNAIAYGNGTFVAVGNDSTILYATAP